MAGKNQVGTGTTTRGKGMEKVKVGIAGAAGYTGCELIRLLAMHPHAEISWLMTGKNNEGKRLHEVFPHLKGVPDRVLQALEPASAQDVDLVFLATPHGVAVSIVPEFLEAGCRVIDVSADYRLKDPKVYEEWYQKKHTAPGLLQEAVYGLTELNRIHLPGARIVANPGCYPTASILALAPLLKEGLAQLDSIVIDAKSGVSGAGRSLNLRTHFSEATEDLQAYNPAQHRHMPEIEQEVSALAGKKTCVTFVPHLIPMIRGMLATVYCKPSGKVETKGLEALYKAFYEEGPFIDVLTEGELPRTKNVWGTNRSEIAVRYDPRSSTILVVAVIDNLIKGASGQAVQNMNVVFELPETSGLESLGLYP
jgi:N-acetyl-gamma-glutamyl-phosphate reductase